MADSIQGERSWHMDSYSLPVHDVDKVRRNFPGYEDQKYYNMDDMREGDWSGATDTDYNSHVHEDDGKTVDGSRSKNDKNLYTSINDTHGTAGDRFKFKTSSPRVADKLNRKPEKIKSPQRTMRGKKMAALGRGR